MSKNETREVTSLKAESRQRRSGFEFYGHALSVIFKHYIFGIAAPLLFVAVAVVHLMIIKFGRPIFPAFELRVVEVMLRIEFVSGCVLTVVSMTVCGVYTLKHLLSPVPSLAHAEPETGRLIEKIKNIKWRKPLRAIRNFLSASAAGVLLALILLYAHLYFVSNKNLPGEAGNAAALEVKPAESVRPPQVSQSPRPPGPKKPPKSSRDRGELAGGNDSTVAKPPGPITVRVSSIDQEKPVDRVAPPSTKPSVHKPERDPGTKVRSGSPEERLKPTSGSDVWTFPPGSIDRSSSPQAPGGTERLPPPKSYGSGTAPLAFPEEGQDPQGVKDSFKDSIEVRTGKSPSMIREASFGALPPDSVALSGKKVTVIVDFDTLGSAKVRGGWSFEKGIPADSRVQGRLKARVKDYIEHSKWASAQDAEGQPVAGRFSVEVTLPK